jgi:hypothetical protein
MDKYIDFGALGQVLLAAIIGGVGLVTLFGLGIRGLAAATSEGEDGGRPAGYVLAGGSFLVVLAGIGLGIYAILAS